MYDFEEHERHLWSWVRQILLTLCGVTILVVGLSVVLHAQEVSSTPLYALQENAGLKVVPSATAPLPNAKSDTAGTAQILFVGDMFFDRQIRFVSDTEGADYPFSCIDSLLMSADMVVGNLEGPITASKSVSLGTIPGSPNNYRFTFPTTTATTLLRHNIQAVTLGNNHILNFGTAGLRSTHKYLDAAGVGYFGGVAGNEPVLRRDISGVPLSFVGFNMFGGASPGDVANVVKDEVSQGRVVIVFSHWGVEYSTSPAAGGASPDLHSIATLFAVNGASAVIGAHPHVVGEHEMMGKTVVYYSLGNLIFDQYFSSAVTHGLALKLTLTRGGVANVEEFPLELKRDGRTCEAT